MVIQKCQQCGEEFEKDWRTFRYCVKCRKEGRFRRYEKLHANSCIDCGKQIMRKAVRCITCANKYKTGLYAGEKNGRWKGGRSLTKAGYVIVKAKREGRKHPYQPEHIVVWEQANGKTLPRDWVVHHFNGIRGDNRLENLVAMPRKRHNMKLAFEPYEQRIHQLEKQLASK